MGYYGGTHDPTEIIDADGDTSVQVERTPDDDIIRFSLGGTTPIVDAVTFDQASGFYYNTNNDSLDFRYNGANVDHVLFMDASTDAIAMRIDETQFPALGFTLKPTLTMLREDSGVGINQFLLSKSNVATRGAFCTFGRSRQDGGGNSIAVVDGDQLGVFQSYGFDGSVYVACASMSYISNGAVSSGIVPTDIHYKTMGTDGILRTRMVVTSSGFINIGGPIGTYAIFNDGGVVFNEFSGTRDFRVESDADTHMLFVDGTENRVGISVSAPISTFETGGSVGQKITTLNAATLTLSEAHAFVAVDYTATGAVTLTLPPASVAFNGIDGIGRTYEIADAGANAAINNIIINPDGSDTIITDITGDTSATINGNGHVLKITAVNLTTWKTH